MALSGWIGLNTGAIRAASALLGLFLGALLAIPLGALVEPGFHLVGLSHPVLVSFVAPAFVYLVILMICKTAGEAVHRKVDAYYKYKASDLQCSHFTRLNRRLGACVALANATVCVFLISALLYMFGYFTSQMAASEEDSTGLKIVNSLSQELEKTGMRKAIAPLVPASVSYYDGADMLGDIFHNPLLQGRLASYPPFLALAERKEFKTLGDDVKFQQFWLEGHSFGELIHHEKIRPLFQSAEIYTNVLGLLKGDLKDFKGYLETGASLKYDEQKILGRWTFNFRESLAQGLKAKPSMAADERRKTRFGLGKMANATLSAMIDNQALLKMPSLSTDAQAQGVWRDGGGGGKYTFSLADKQKKLELDAAIEANKLVLRTESYTWVFEK